MAADADDAADDLAGLTDEQRRLVAFSRRFDLRNIIGLTLVVYGVVTVVMGLLNGAADRQQAAGISINLWTGVPLLVVGALFFIWAARAPRAVEDLVGADEGDGDGPEEHPDGAADR